MNRLLGAALACAFGLLAPHAAVAQTNVSKIIVPFAPGGGQDVLARVIAPELGRLLGQSFIIENRAGAGGAVGGGVVARSATDGTTLLMAASSHTISAALNRNPPFDPIKDFTAVAHVGSGAYVLLVNARLPAKTTAELIAHVKSNPGKLNYASAGVGSATHLASAYFAARADINIVHVPYKSTAEALNSVMTGDTQVLIVPTIGSQGYISNPDLRVLAVVSKSRVASLPDTPTVDESGLPGFEFTSWFGLLGPAGMPPEVTARINAALTQILASPDIAAKIQQQGVEPRAIASAAFAELLVENYETMKAIVKTAGPATE
ncbi:MAG: Tripartite-type tricarboxylate transporter, receptor component TctC [Hyphomicrobiales bacterium]|nr:Tripartite-type tricarboxylate transporter, receptor component TctC [Hyphomicrobiales bacterium]